MRRSRVLAGIGGIAFSVLTIVGLGVANPPGGTYKASDAVKYVAKGHHVAVFVAAYLFLIAVLGLLFLLAYLRDLISGGPGGERTARIFWGTGVAAATSFAPPDGTRPITSPAVWTRQWGKGRIFVCTAGHHVDILEDPNVRTIVQRGLLWASR